jgi:PAT family beta-lactamase induction signal transducer AmpG
MPSDQKKMTLKEAILNKRMLNCIFNGFTAGLPIYFIIQLIPAWLRSEGVDLKTIGFFGLVLLPYSFKYVWSPLLDRYVPPFLGRRRGWMIITQVGIMSSMIFLALFNPKDNLDFILYIGFAIAYRLAGFIPGGLGLILADYMPWRLVIILIALFMIVGVIYTLKITEAAKEIVAPASLKEAIIEPFKEFFTRDGGFKTGLLILSFIFFYKFGDTVATSLITPFYLDVGFSTSQIGAVAKIVGVWSMIIGGFFGGVLMFKIGINKSLWIFGFVQMASILGFAFLNEIGPNIWALGVVVAFEYLGVGLGSAALMAFIAKNSNKNFTGTQYALLTSLFAIPKAFSGIVSGVMIEGIKLTDGLFFSIFGNTAGMGYTNYFYVCTALAIPGMILLLWVAPFNKVD